MSGPFQHALVITGGASGIGGACVREALDRGWLVASCDVLPMDRVPARLLHDHAIHVQADVRDAQSVRTFRDHAIQSFRDHNLGSVPTLGVVACAGISRRGDPEQVRLMKDVNEGGTLNLLWAFANDLGERGLFAGLSSIVAAEGIAVKGDEEYKATKAEATRIAVEEARETFGVRGFAVAPGAIDTPMTRNESIFAMLLLGAARVFGSAGHRLHKEVARLAGVAPGSPPATVLEGLLGPDLAGAADFKNLRKRLKADPGLEQIGKSYLLYANPRGEDGKVRPRAELIARAADVLAHLDVVIGPEPVARAMLDQLASGAVPPGGLLKVYSRSGEDRIKELLGSLAG
ncbi:MAG: SDR family oxidoreductase [Planctomycetes bacterium]|nr:SDR family oxidoreductase [Planctomycetota bacterium]